ncbi:MAG: SDR family oxidoreductase [Ktedonobacteraceae bacterium]|nr:SDR family oxidoreductase [Ktedonobacteraceae bacterium]
MTYTVLITGSSSGIGQATTQLFAQQGWNVAATARNPASLVPLAGASVLALPLDVTDEASIAAAVEATTARFGSIDALVNNAGYGLFGPLEGITDEQLEQQLRTNVFGVVALIRQVVPLMRQRHSGTIITISSTGGRVASPFAAAYHASKYALEGLCESLRFELKPQGIRVKLVEPGHVKTGFIRSLTWATHSAYEPYLSNWRAQVEQSDDHAPGCEGVARVIFKAATDQSWRLRYPTQAGPILALHAALPDSLWASMVSTGLNRPPRSR